MKRVIVTTSWDDGHKLDVRLAALLRKYKMPGTFYVSPQDREFAQKDLLRDAQVQALAKDFEIGAHTMTHPRLPDIPDQQARLEMADSKTYLEKLLKKPVVSFCYPGGEYNVRHAQMAQELGFMYARTVRRHIYDLKGSVFEADTTVNAYNHYQDIPKIWRFAGYNPAKVPYYFQWQNLAKAMFDKVMREGGIFHLWGHSWEIDQHGDWEKLEEVLQYVGGRSGVQYVTNGELPGLQAKKLLVASPYFPPHIGGTEKYAYHTAKQLAADHGWDVSVVTTGGRGLRVHREMQGQLPVYRLPYWFKISNTLVNPLWHGMMKRIIAAEQATIVNAHAPVPGFGDSAVRASRVPAVVTYHMASMKKHNPYYDWLIAWYESKVLPRTFAKAAGLIATSGYVHRALMQPFASKTSTVTPGTDVGFYTPAQHLAADTVLFVGSMNKADTHKGLSVLLQAFVRVLAAQPQAKLLVAGDGNARPAFEAQAKQLGIAKHTIFLGAQYGADLRGAYRRATMLVLPSLNENFALVALEAMACGLPVVGTRVGSIPDIIDDGKTGYLVAPGDPTAIAERVAYLLAHHHTAARMGSAARRKAEQQFSWHHKVAATDMVLRKTLGMPIKGDA